jgi:hypothetical protein
VNGAPGERFTIKAMGYPEGNRVGSPRIAWCCAPWRRKLTVLTAAAIFFSPAAAQARKKKPQPLTPAEEFALHIQSLAQPLYGQEMDETGATTREIQKLMLDHMQAWLEQHPPSDKPTVVPYDVDVRRELESAFSKVRFPVYALPATFAQPWKGRLLIGVGYTLGWSKFDRSNVVALFDRAQGQVKLAAVTNFIPRTDMHYEFLPPPPSGDFRLLVYGTRLGKSHPRLSAELYSFDGQKLESLWKTEDAYDGKLDVEGDRVVVNYMKESEFIEAATYGRIPPRYEAVYKITPKGLELVTDHQVSAQGQ